MAKIDEMVSGVDDGSEETALVKADAELATLTSFSDEVAFSAEDLIIPRIRLGQSLTEEVQNGAAAAGQYILEGFEPLEAITIVPMLMARRRMLLNDNQELVCRSGDSLIGVGDPGGECKVCPMNQWTESADGKRHPPACTFMYSYIVYVPEWEVSAIMDFKKTSIKAGQLLNSMVQRSGFGKCAAEMQAVKRTNNRNQAYFVMMAKPVSITEQLIADAQANTAATM